MNANNRNSAYPIDPMFLERWSPRAFTAEELPRETLMTILEAGHWAASSSNSQPWRFVYALRGSEHWQKLLGLLVPGNAKWAQHAAALIVVGSATKAKSAGSDEEKPLTTHSFDTGAACACMVLQALKLGWHAHGMAGFDHARAHSELNMPPEVAVEAVFAIGRIGDKELLPDDLKGRETPSSRKPLDVVVFDGSM